MQKVIRKILDSGIWIQPIILTLIIKFIQDMNPKLLKDESDWVFCFLLSFLPGLLLGIEERKKPNQEDAFRGKEAAMYPPVPKEILHKTPTGVIMGKNQGKYVCMDVKEDGHFLCIGGSGSGKSSCVIIPTILSNPDTAKFVLDIKGELYSKATINEDERVLIMNPQDRSTYGYNPFYSLKEDSSGQEILETMQTITNSLISIPAGLKDPFWKISSRQLLLGLLVYFYKKGIHDLVSIVDEILGRPIQDSIKDVMENAKPNSAEYRCIVQFAEMSEETLGGIVAEMNNHLVIFANDSDIRYAFKENGLKISPGKLEEGYSIFLVIREEKLSAYYDVLQLVINQTLSALETRSEDAPPILFIIDELPRVLSSGKLDRLLDGARTLRSRRVRLVLVTQSTEAMMSAYTENETADLMSNCTYKIILSASSLETQKTVCAWAGTCKVRKKSWNGTGNKQQVSFTYEEKDIVAPSDLVALPQTGEVIVISPYGYARLKKTPYYKDKLLKKMADEIKRQNEKPNVNHNVKGKEHNHYEDEVN